MRHKILASVALALLSSSAFAADDSSWTGWYLGANVGRGNVDSTSEPTLGGTWLQPTYDGNRAELVRIWSIDQDGNGFQGGVQGGYNHQFDRVVVGFELDYGTTNVNALDRVGPVQMTTAPAQLQATHAFDTGASYSLRPRIGFTVNDNKTLLYATAGVSYLKVKSQTDLFIPISNYSKYGEAEKTVNGFTWGVGVEHRFNPRWSAKFEYVRANLGDFSYGLADRTGTSMGATETFTRDTEYNAFRIGLNYHF